MMPSASSPCSHLTPGPHSLLPASTLTLQPPALVQACVVAHSYGTFVASRLVQDHGDRAVSSLALIDPVCFCECEIATVCSMYSMYSDLLTVCSFKPPLLYQASHLSP